jgi:polysaccharide export outer membrane protein
MVTSGYAQLDSEQELAAEEDIVSPVKPEIVSNLGNVLLDQVIDVRSYIVGPGDRFKIAVSGPIKSGGVLEVSPTGMLMVPEIGQVDVKNKTLAESMEMIEALVKTQVQGAKIFIDLLTVREFKVMVYGAVDLPGFHRVNAAMRIYEIGKLAGLKHIADLSQIYIIKESGDTLSCNWFKLIDQGDLKQNPYLQEGDRLFIPSATHDKNVIAVRGAAEVNGYYALGANESVFSFINRFVKLMEVADMSSIFIIRTSVKGEEYIRIDRNDFLTFELVANDIIQLLRVEPIRVNGYVNEPGVFDFVPGQTALDYIATAGGAMQNGDVKKIAVIRGDKTIRYNADTILQPGDIIEVKRTRSDILFGEISILQFVTSTATIVLSYLAITK